ncbi:tetratricopeptide repeat protein [Azospirillum picis]|uniref:Flp pilus assembly protein TadD n=1 Tax=Azospirillum picis TaxID=488438 RepID=A0ABU0MGX6_9PROT|nr:tetratricopeptide repeat protein [Azospirillum picis]MBP2299051.1 Flp pilus assembly protein TadD [Azospirillum picis]MDQ0532707.1 Flp pilus assembly protein TadD [Azospirillum picis]
MPLHQAGRLGEAEALYRRALAVRPRQPDALHLLGMVACQTSRFHEAIDLIGKAVAAKRDVPDYHANLAFAFQALGRSSEAEAAARAALRLRRPFPEASNTLGNALNAQGRCEEAAHAYRAALDARPGYAEAEGNLGIVLRALGRPAEAEPSLRRAIAANPGLTDAQTAYGLTLLDLGRAREGEAVLRAVLDHRPDHAGATLALAGALQRGGKDASPVYRRHATLDPADAEAWNALGLALQAAERMDEAAAAFSRARHVRPAMVEALTNLGTVRRLQGRAVESAALQRLALDLLPDYAAARTNLGLALQESGDEAAAEHEFTRALEQDPSQSLGRFNRAILRLRQGRLTEGWDDYRVRFDSGRLRPKRPFAIPEWQGDELAGRRLLLWAEQGLGDELMFGALLPEALARFGPLIVECEPRLVSLMRRSFPGTIVRAPSGEARDADCHLPFGSLPRLLWRAVPHPPPLGWLMPDPHRVAEWRRRVDGLGPGLKIGIAWTSGRITVERRRSYTDLMDWAPLLRLPGLQVVSLQYDGRDDEIVEVEKALSLRIHRWNDLDQVGDLEGTAALMANLDLAVTIASSAGEMAAALGVPVWRLGHRDWTQLGTMVRPWFPSMRCIPPDHGQGVGSAIPKASQRLRRLLEGKA